VYKSLITEELCLCLNNNAINLFGIVTPPVMFYFLQMANLGKCANLAQEMLLQLLLQLLVPMTLI
jgi:predicted Na+-dependent transporter